MQLRRHGEISPRTRFDENEFVIYQDYAEIILYDKYGVEKGRTIIDLEDVEKCKKYKWYMKNCNNKLYVIGRIDGKSTRLHRYILDFYGDLDIDHKDGDGLNNKRNNLRIATRQENMMNQRVLPKNNTSGHIGIWFNKKNNKYTSQIKVNRKGIHLGEYSILEDAIKARKEAEIKYFGENKFANYENKN
jgi:hypothetical protein